MGAREDGCRCCGRPLEAAPAKGARGVCGACAGTRRNGAPPEAPARAPPTIPAEEAPPAAGAPPPPLPSPGTDLGGLLVEGPLGEGGMGLVVVARDPGLDRRVAVKFLRGTMVGNARAERFFRREGRALAGIAHPHVVRVFSVGSWEGRPFLVMELVEGTTLADRLRAGTPPLPEVLRIAEELASALAAVHGARIAHRDVNPSNVVLRNPGGAVCLIDFGVAKVLERATETSGAVAGTPLYMAPEQVARQRLDHRVDVYAFGATLFEMVTGRVPHECHNTAAFFRSVLHEDAPLLRTLRPGAPRDLEVLLARALARAPELRQRDGSALLEEVRRLRRSLPAGEEGAAGVVSEGDPGSGPAAAAGDPPPPRDPSESQPLVGRNAPYTTAVRALEGIHRHRGAVLLVEGEPGAGKSRFLREVVRAALAEGIGVLRCAGAEFTGTPFRALRAALLEYGRTLGALDPEAVAALAARSAPANRPLGPALRWFLAPSHGEGEGRPARSDLVQAVLALLRSFLAARPALLVVEDAHHLDAGTLDVLVSAAEQGTSWPLGIALAYRPPDRTDPRLPLGACIPRLRGVPGAVHIALEPLPEAAVATLIHLSLGVDEAEACRLAPLLHRRSSGNPLYVVEALRLLEQERAADRGGGRKRVRQRLTTLAIPPRLLELAVRRMSGLPQAEREALGVASIDPAGVTSEVVARCLDVSRLGALRLLQSLSHTRGLLHQEGDRYRVSHGEIRDAVYGELLAELREAYHAEAARFLREAGAVSSEPARLGRHLRGAGLPAEAAPLLLEAGRRLLHSHSPAEALEFFEEALLCAAPAGLPGATVGRAQALEVLGELESARGLLEDLLRSGDRGAEEALLPLAEFERNRGRHREALALLERAEASPADLDRRLRRLLLQAQALSQVQQGEEALRVLEEADSRFPEASAVRRLEIRNTQGTVRWRLGRYEEARLSYEEALPLAEEIGALNRTAILLYNLGLVCSDLDRGKEALEWVDRAVERALLAGNQRTLIYSRILRAEVLVEALRVEEAAAALEEAAAGLEDLESLDARYLFAACRAEVEFARGRFGEALEWADRGLALVGENPQRRSEFRVLRAQVLLESGRAGEALEEARRALAEAPGEGPGVSGGDALACAARALRVLGRDGEERAALRRMTETTSHRAALERALEEEDPGERERWVAVARGLARNHRAREWIGRRVEAAAAGR